MSPKVKLALSHTCAWFVYVGLALLVYGYGVGIPRALPETIVAYSFAIGVFYFHLFILRRTLAHRRVFSYMVCLACIFTLHALLKYLTFTSIYPLFVKTPTSLYGHDPVDVLITFSWQAFIYVLFSTGYWMAERLIAIERLARATEREAADIERLELTNAALRAQINPHFFINTMMYFHGETVESLPQVATGMEAMMTFVKSSIAETDASGLIPISEEIAVIESLITIFSRRFPKSKIDYHNGLKSDFKIVPHVLSAFVENAFKHGSYTKEGNDLVIKLDEGHGDLKFAVYNKKNDRPKDSSRGIGIRYIKSQLERLYPGRYSLDIVDTKDDYLITLTISNIAYENQLHYS